MRIKSSLWTGLAGLLLLSACTTNGPANSVSASGPDLPTAPAAGATAASLSRSSRGPLPPVPSIEAPFLPTPNPGAEVPAPTPDAPRTLPPMRLNPETYVVQPGDSLATIAQNKGAAVSDLLKANDLSNPDLLSAGQSLTIPAPTPKPTGPGTKILPDSELVYGPAAGYFDVQAYVQGSQGYLSQYSEDVAGVTMTGAQIVQRVANEYSVNPRLLLAVVEYRSGWLSQAAPPKETLQYPAGWVDPNRPGLYRQLAWAANNLNRGYYLWRVNGLSHWVLADASYVPIDPRINAGTAGVQNLMALFFGYDDWLKAVSVDGFTRTFTDLFGNPFAYAVEPLLPVGLTQPTFQLPFEPGQSWSFTGGPHGGYADGSAWAAIDFAPPGDALGCVQSDAWVTAMAPGVIVRTGDGAVIEDLDGDGLEQTGWSILYMHIETRDRVQPGTQMKAGNRIGHPSCEGGVSNGTHTHIARRYNGEWIPADGNIPYNMDGWISAGYGSEYDGVLRRNGQTVEAWAGRKPENQITR